MSGAERIWAFDYDLQEDDGTWRNWQCWTPDHPAPLIATEYARADLLTAAEAEIARLTAALAQSRAETQAVWPDFVAPPKFENPCEGWEDPRLPDFRLIWKVARECGYSIGLHGSMRRDCDMIAAPWTDDAVIAFDLIDRLCAALNARVVGPVAGKPHGRLGWNLQVDGWVKVIDISVMPRACDLTPSTARDAYQAAIAAAEQAGYERGLLDGREPAQSCHQQDLATADLQQPPTQADGGTP